MSNPIKAIGKVFKGVVRVVKKIALPVIAIGAAVLTGGAALGILPGMAGATGAAGIASSLGISQGLAGVIATAGQGALMGMATSAVTGGNIVKGAVTGGVLGAATGGIGQMVKGAGGAMSAGSAISNTPADIVMGKDIGTTFAAPAASGSAATGGGIGSMVTGAAKTVAPVAQAAAPVASVAAPTATAAATGTGIGSLVSAPFQILNGLDPYTRAGLIQGIGQGIMGKAQADASRQAETDRYERISDNYANTSGFYTPSGSASSAPPKQGQRVIWKVDAVTGNVYKDYE